MYLPMVLSVELSVVEENTSSVEVVVFAGGAGNSQINLAPSPM